METFAIFLALVGLVAVPYWLKTLRHRRNAVKTWEKNSKADLLTPATLHPKINILTCIGCASCVRVCPEDVLGIVDGHASIVSGMKCVGHAICADVCPVGAITMGFGTPRQGMEIPLYNDNFETNVPGLYIIGELGGVGLIRNAVNQGIRAVEDAARRKRACPANGFDVIIVGAGPAGMSAALACKSHRLRYVVLEQDEVGGTILHYPRQKLVLTAPVDLPLHGRLKVSEISKEELLGIWQGIIATHNLDIRTRHKVDAISTDNGMFRVVSGDTTLTGAAVLLALGRRGSPRKLGVPGENLPKVMYRLIEAETYKSKHILVVGGGDSAVEAAVGLAGQKGNVVTMSYRREEFVRLKEKNEKRVAEMIKARRLRVLFNSSVREILPDTVTVQESPNIMHTLQNHFVFVFAGGELPTALLKQAGVRLRDSNVDVLAA